jgi:hypothetical protein
LLLALLLELLPLELLLALQVQAVRISLALGRRLLPVLRTSGWWRLLRITGTLRGLLCCGLTRLWLLRHARLHRALSGGLTACGFLALLALTLTLKRSGAGAPPSAASALCRTVTLAAVGSALLFAALAALGQTWIGKDIHCRKRQGEDSCRDWIV